MAFGRPTLTQLVDRIHADFVSKLELTGAVLRRSIIYVMTRVFAGAVHMRHAHLEYLGKQLFPDKSDEEFLVRQASLFGLSKTAPTQARALANFSGTDTTVIPAGTVVASDAGFEYTTDAEVEITSGTAAAEITAVLAGSDSNLIDGVVLSLQTPISGVDSAVEVPSVISDGIDQESTEDLRARLLSRMSDPPMGGSDADYITWAKEVSGVTRVWVTPLGLGPGTVVIRFVRDNDGAGSAIIPSGGEISDVQAYIDPLAPAHATVTVSAPTYSPDNFTFSAISPDTAEMKAAVEAELTDLYQRKAEPGRTMLISEIRTAIGGTPGLTDYTLTSPSADVTHTSTQLPGVGTLTWP